MVAWLKRWRDSDLVDAVVVLGSIGGAVSVVVGVLHLLFALQWEWYAIAAGASAFVVAMIFDRRARRRSLAGVRPSVEDIAETSSARALIGLLHEPIDAREESRQVLEQELAELAAEADRVHDVVRARELLHRAVRAIRRFRSNGGAR